MKILVWLTLCIIWSTTWIFIKIGLSDLPPITFSSARFGLSVLILSALVFLLGVRMPRGRKEWRLVALTGFLQFSINYSAVFWSEQYIESGLAAVLQSSISVFGLVLAWIFLPTERITRAKIAGVVLGMIGVAVIFVDQLRVESFWSFMGCVAIVVGAYAAAQSSILVKAKGSGLHFGALVLSQMICGLPAIILYALLREGDPFSHNWSLRAIGCVLYLAVAGTVAAFWLYYWLLSRIESTKAMMISLVTPLLAVVIGAVFLNEKLPTQTLIGGLLILASLGLIVIRKRNIEPPRREGANGIQTG